MTTNEQTRVNHACDACGGTSRIIVPIRPQDNKGNPYTTATCPVCLGAGRISDRMPAKDAIADAETLRTMAVRSESVWAAVVAGEEALADGSPEAWEYAASAAFRAVPALRGED